MQTGVPIEFGHFTQEYPDRKTYNGIIANSLDARIPALVTHILVNTL